VSASSIAQSSSSSLIVIGHRSASSFIVIAHPESVILNP